MFSAVSDAVVTINGQAIAIIYISPTQNPISFFSSTDWPAVVVAGRQQLCNFPSKRQ
jgi:hypothetical protein